MSFGFAIGDFIAVGELALKLYKDVYKVSRTAPAEVKELAKELSVLSISLHLLTEEAQNSQSVLVQSGESRVNMVKEMISNTKETLSKLEAYSKKHELVADQTTSRPLFRRTWDKMKFSKDASTITSLRARISYHCGVINLLLTSVGNSSLERLHSENQSIARNTDEALSLLRSFIAHSSETENHRSAGCFNAPIISASEADVIKEELSFQFLKSVESVDQGPWLETSIDVWLSRGQHWCSQARFEMASVWTLRNCSLNSETWEHAYKAALTALLKSSWIVMDVIRNHPMRTYITSGRRQLSIASLSSDITAEMKTLREMNDSLHPSASTLDIIDFEVTKIQERDDESKILPRFFTPSKDGVTGGPLPLFQSLVKLKISDFGSEYKIETCLLRIDQCSSDWGLQLTILGPEGFTVELVSNKPMLKHGLWYPSERLLSKSPGTVPCCIFSEAEIRGHILFAVQARSSAISRAVAQIELLLQNVNMELLTVLENFLKNRLRYAHRLLRPEFNFVPSSGRGPSPGYFGSRTDEHDLLVSTVALAFLLDRSVSKPSTEPIEMFLDEVYEMILEYRWWIFEQEATIGGIPVLDDDELEKAVSECAQYWNRPLSNLGPLVSKISPSEKAYGVNG